MRVFIGGSKTLKKLTPAMISALECVCREGHTVYVGDCFGTDRLVQEYLAKRGYDNVWVFASGRKCRNNMGRFSTIYIPADDREGFEFYRAKDEIMAVKADCGLMFWDGKSRGTRCNIDDLYEQEKFTAVIVY